jgi:hypothetical protein
MISTSDYLNSQSQQENTGKFKKKLDFDHRDPIQITTKNQSDEIINDPKA